MVKSPRATLEMQEMWVRPLRWEDPLEKGMATDFGIPAWRIPSTEEPGRLYSIGLQIVGYNRASACACTRTHTHTHTHTECKAEEPGRLYSTGSQIVGYNRAPACARTHARTHTHTHTKSKVKISIPQVSRAGCMFPNRSDC